jgi:hypothetical protein
MLWSSSLCSHLHPPATSSHSGPNILLSTLFSNTLNPYSSLTVREKKIHDHLNQQQNCSFLLAHLRFFLFTTASRPALGPTQPLIQWVSESPSLGVKWLRRETDRSSPSSAEVEECVELYHHSPNTPPWRGSQLKKDSTAITLPL